MTEFSEVLADVFERRSERRLTVTEEAEAIRLAKQGDQEATVALIYSYAPALRNAVARHPGLDRDEARSAAVTGLLEAVRAFDSSAHDRLAGILRAYLSDALAQEEGIAHGFAVPPRTLKRFFGILRHADGDPVAALALAPEYAMAPETFLDVLTAVRGLDWLYPADDEDEQAGDVLDRARPIWSGDHADADDRVLVERAFRAVDALEERVCRVAYGFEDYDPQPDAEVAHRLGISRQKAQRARSSALTKMRSALGVA